ncbi:hypothetical protein [Streptomyces rochei]
MGLGSGLHRVFCGFHDDRVCSEFRRFVTGAELFADGGYTRA